MTTASIQSLQNGITPVNDASRDDLVLSDVVTVTSLNVGTAYQWTIAFKPEGSAAVFTSTGTESAVNRSPGTFTVDVDGPYLIRLAYSTPQITLNTVLAAGVTFTINGVLLTAVAVARTPGNNDFSVATGTIAGITAEIVAALNDGANAFTAANVAGTDASPSVVINPIAETVPTGETVTITYSGTASDVTVAAFVTEQYVRLRSLTAFGDLKLVAAGERYDTLRVPVDAQPAGWADTQNYNLNQLLSLISSTDPSTGVVYVDPINGDFQTIQAAMDYATAQTPTLAQQWVVLVRPGIYVEDLTFYPWVHLFGWPGGETTPLVKVRNATVASHSIALPGAGTSLVLCDIWFEQPVVSPNPAFLQTGAGDVQVIRCTVEAQGNTGEVWATSSPTTFTLCTINGNGINLTDYALRVSTGSFTVLDHTTVLGQSCLIVEAGASVYAKDSRLTASGYAINSLGVSTSLDYCTVIGVIAGNPAGTGTAGDLVFTIKWCGIEILAIDGLNVVGTAKADLGATTHGKLTPINGALVFATVPADTILYDNTTSGLAAINVQDAIDEVYAYAQLVRTLDNAYDGGIVGTGSGRTIIADQGAVQIVDALAPSDPVPPGNTNGNLEVVGSVKLGALTKAEITIDPNPFDNGPAILLGKEIWANDAPYGSTALILGDASGNPTFHNYNLRVGTKEASGGNQVGSVFVRAGDSLTTIDAGAVYLQGGTATDAGGGVGGDIIVVPGETAAGGARAMVLANPLTATSATLTAAGAFSGAAVAGTLTLGTETGAITVTFVGGEVLAAVHALFDATGIVTAAGDPIVLTTVMKGGTAEAFFLNETPAGVDAALGTFSGQAMVSGTWPDTVELGASAPGTFIVGVNAANPMLYDTATGKLTVPGLIDPTGVIFDEAGQPATGAAKGAVFVSDGSVGVQNDLYYADQAGVLVNISAAAAGVTNHAALTNLSWLLSAHIGANGSLATFDGATGAATLLTGVAQGDLAYFDGTDWTRLAPGAAGQLLQTQGIGADPIWAAGVGTDELVKVTANDTTPGYLLDKLITATTGVAWTEINNGADEDLRLDVSTASTAGQGLIEIATQAEVDGGADTTRAVTPAALASATTVIKPGDAPTGDLGGTYPNPMVTDFTIAGESQGSVLYFNGVNWSQLSPGVAGQVLQTQGVGANPLWAAGGAGSSDHATLSNILWTASAHTGTASRIAAFDGGGAASYVQVGVDVQAWDTDLDALAALATTGLLVRTGAGTATTRSIVQPAAGITVTNGNGVAGDPTLALADDLAALEALAGTGIAVRTAANTWAERTLTGTLNRITVTNGDGVAGNPTLDVGSNVLVSGDAAGGDLSGTYPNPTVTDLTLTGEAQGTLAYFSGTNWVVLPVGTNGQLLQTQGAGANPQWVTSSGGGVTNTVVGSLGITNVGTNTDADLTPTYGTTASTVTEGNDARLVSTLPVPIAEGGTAAITAAAARTNLDVAQRFTPIVAIFESASTLPALYDYLADTERPEFDTGNAAATIYANAATGSDTTGVGTALLPYATFKRAFQACAASPTSSRTIRLQGAGPYNAGGLNLHDLNRITVEGDEPTVALSRTITSVGASSASTGLVLTDADGAMGVDAQRGRLVKFTSGVLNAKYGVVIRNAANQTEVTQDTSGATFLVPSIGDTYDILTDWVTVWDFPDAADYVVESSSGSTFRHVKFTGTGKYLFVNDTDKLDFSRCRFEITGLLAGRGGSIFLSTCSVANAGAGFSDWGMLTTITEGVTLIQTGTLIDAVNATASTSFISALTVGMIETRGEVAYRDLGVSGIVVRGSGVIALNARRGTIFNIWRFVDCGAGILANNEGEGWGWAPLDLPTLHGNITGAYTLTATGGGRARLGAGSTVTDATGTASVSADDGATNSAQNPDGTYIEGGSPTPAGFAPVGSGGGVTNTVVGSLGITNVGTNTDADLTPTYGAIASTVTEGNDARLSDARVPTGAAGGDLGGTYPNPTVDDGADGTAIHDNIAGEILAVPVKLTPVSLDLLLIEDSAGGNAKKRITVGSLPTGGGGEANTASNVNTAGVGVFKQKTGVDLEFRGVKAASAKATVVLDAPTNEVRVDVADASDTQAGAIEIATQAEVDGLTDTTRAVTSATLAGSTLAGDVTANNAKVTNATHTGDVTGATALTIAANAVVNTMLADVATGTLKGRATAGTGDPEDLNGTQATTLLDLFTPTLQGVVPLSGGVATDFLSADGTWSVPTGTGGVTNTVVGSLGITNVGTNTDADLAPTYGTTASTVTQGNDARLSDARVPTGAAGGELGGTYPNPTVNDGADATAIHDNVAGEIAAIAVKGTPVGTDFLIIEDSAAANAKKHILISSLPGGGGESNTGSNVNVGGVGVFKQKTGVDLEFRGINAASAKATVVLDAGNNEIDIDVADASLTQAGAIELATQAEVDGLLDTTRAIVPSTLAGSTLAGDVTANNAKVTNATHTGDVIGATVLTIDANKVLNTMLADVATATFKGRVTAATGDPEDLTGTQATTLLDTFTTALQGVVPASGGVATDFLSADGTWSVPAGTATLQTAYAGLNTILSSAAEGGPVAITTTVDETNAGLSVTAGNHTVATAQTLVSLTGDAEQTGDVQAIANPGTGKALSISTTGAAQAGAQVQIDIQGTFTSGTAGPDGIHIDYGTSDLSSTAFPVGLTLDMASTTIGNSTFVYGVYLQGNAGTAPAETYGLIVDSGWDMGIQLAGTTSMWLSDTSRLLFGGGGGTAQTAGDMQIRYNTAGIGNAGIYIEESSVLGAGGGNGNSIVLNSQPGGVATGATNAGVGGRLYLRTGDGGDAGAGTGNSGSSGNILIQPGVGGAADATGPEAAANGGFIRLTSGEGGAGAGAGTSGAGGDFDLNGGNGGAGTALTPGGAGGLVSLDAGNGGADGGGGLGPNGAITIGTGTAGAITVGGAQSGAVKVSTAAGNDSAILALSALGASGEAFSIYGGSNAPTASADAGSTFFRDTGTGGEAYLNTSTGGSGTTWDRIVVQLSVEAKTATYNVVVDADQGRAFTNEGSTGAANLRPFNLPTAVAGASFTFITQDADLLRIVAAAGDTIRLGSTVSGVAGNIESTAIGDVVELIAINATEWIARSIVGTWTVN